MNESDDLSMHSSVVESKEGMAQTLSFPQYSFVKHFKLTATYLLIHCPIFQHLYPLEDDSPLFIHNKDIRTKYNVDHCYQYIF